jgi:hypothetical protein
MTVMSFRFLSVVHLCRLAGWRCQTTKLASPFLMHGYPTNKNLAWQWAAYRVQNSAQSSLRNLFSIGVAGDVIMIAISFLRIFPSHSWEGLVYVITIGSLHRDI